jgi:hypothetical protein
MGAGREEPALDERNLKHVSIDTWNGTALENSPDGGGGGAALISSLQKVNTKVMKTNQLGISLSGHTLLAPWPAGRWACCCCCGAGA